MTTETVTKVDAMTPGEFDQAAKIVRRALAKGWKISVNDSYHGDGEWTVLRSTSFDQIMAALATTGGDTLSFRDANDVRIGRVMLIYGNEEDGSEAVADFSWSQKYPGSEALMEALCAD